MKLLSKTSKYYVVVPLLIFLIGGILFFLTIRSFVNDDVVQKLGAEKVGITDQIRSLDSIPNKLFAITGNLSFKKINPEISNFIPLVRDTVLYDEKEGHEEVPAKTITFLAKSKFYSYQITLIKSLVESDDLIEVIAIALFVLIVLFLVSFYYLNFKVSKIIWSPFYHSLYKIKGYNLSSNKKLTIPTSDIDEFNELNLAVELMTEKIQADYNNLKEFTEDASHEIQTPLAIIKTKLELLVQSDMREEQMLLVQSINDAATKLSRLNHALLLLTKIENQQYSGKEVINITKLIEKHINNYKELIEARGVSLLTHGSVQLFVEINPLLADILIANLIGNAIKHNIKDGQIHIEILSKNLSISNTGNPLNQNPILLFERFKKDSSHSESLGLGLSIVKKICETEHIQISYKFNQPIHRLNLDFGLQN